MKITAVTPVSIGQFLFVEIETDAGITGLGESGTWGHLAASRAAIDTFAEHLLGKDPGPIERHWNLMHRFSHFQGAAINGAIAAIDIALWDIKGKALGVPVHSLLGGPCRDRARVYGHAYGKTADELVENCVALKDAGFNAVGHINPFLDEREDEPFFAPHVAHMSRAVETVRRVREALGAEVDMLLELHRRLTPAEAIDFIPRIEPYLPYWCEDPIRPENPDAMAEVARRVHAPIATGERYASLHDFRALFARDGAGFARVDVALCGGITGARKVAAMAEAHHVMVAPHNPLSPLGLAACLHLAAAIPNFAIQEYTTGFEALKMETSLQLLGSDVVIGVPPMEDGFVAIPNEPGLGVAICARRSGGPPADSASRHHAPAQRRLCRRPVACRATRALSRPMRSARSCAGAAHSTRHSTPHPDWTYLRHATRPSRACCCSRRSAASARSTPSWPGSWTGPCRRAGGRCRTSCVWVSRSSPFSKRLHTLRWRAPSRLCKANGSRPIGGSSTRCCAGQAASWAPSPNWTHPVSTRRTGSGAAGPRPTARHGAGPSPRPIWASRRSISPRSPSRRPVSRR